jgi:L-ascorbate metabolism protein UlaG (beta-lactamase superfamily)
LEYLLITHAHTDHFNPETVAHILRGGACTLVLARSCGGCAREYGLDPEHIRYANPGHVPLDTQNNPLPVPRVGGLVTDLPDWLSVEAIRALHGHRGGSVYGGATEGDCGYILRLGGRTIVQPGDSVLLQEHLEIKGIDVLLVSPTEHNMGVENARTWLQTVRPRWALAQHFGTYYEDQENAFWTHGYPRELRTALDEETRQRYVIPEYGVPMELD